MNQSTNKKTHVFEVLGYIALTIVLCFFLQALVVPKYMSHPVEGAIMPEYYKSKAQHDVIFIGDCEFYESISPITLWENYGISSYVRGSAQQLIWQSYYVLKDTLLIEKPKVVVLNVTELKYGTVQNEAYTRLCLDGMKSVKYKLTAAKLSKKEENESLISYILPIMRYHSRWSDLNQDDFKYMFKRDIMTHEGYLMYTDVRPQTQDISFQKPLLDYSFPELCWGYLDDFVKLCNEEGITFVLMKAPIKNWMYSWYDEWDQQIEAYAEKNGLTYINGTKDMNNMGLDMSTDTYDEGIHLNVYGAEKFSDYLGEILKKEYDYKDGRSDEKQSKIWDDICQRYYEERGRDK